MTDVTHADVADAPRSLVAISNAMVRLYKTQFGRGPTKSRTDWAGPDILIATLQDSLTLAERNLAAMGEDDRLRDMRMFFQKATEGMFREAVEEITGRRVKAFVSGIDIFADISSEVFYLHPVDSSDTTAVIHASA